MNNKKITYFGILRSITSWAKVSREMVSSLLSLGLDINIYERKGFLFNSRFPLDYTIKKRITNQFKGDIVFTFEHPRTYNYLPKQSFNIGLLVYEFTSLPEMWVKNINQYLDLVFVPSEFCRKVFLNSGVDKDKIKVLRYGFNPKYYYPEYRKAANIKEFTFLCIANPHKREGIELLLQGFKKAFSKKDKVKLKIKLSYIPKGRIKSFEYDDLAGLFDSYVSKKDSPAIEFIYNQLAEKEVGDLYRKSNCYVSLSRAEAFGLCFLEALACGLPVISVKWGGQTDFLNNKNTYFVKYTLMPTSGEEYEKASSENLIALPDVNHAADIMYNIYYNRDNMDKGNFLFPDPSYFWWSRIAREFLDLIGVSI